MCEMGNGEMGVGPQQVVDNQRKALKIRSIFKLRAIILELK
jgi:hypothetical protein